MWVLVVFLNSITPHPVGLQPTSMRIATESREECIKLKEHMQSTWKFDRYRLTISCTFMGHVK